jgi:hypothetical protein
MSKRPFALLCFVFMIILLLYASAHTWEVDEAWTYVSVKGQSLTDLLLYKNFNIANNHLLNSLWFRFLQTMNARSILLYRGVSLLCFPFFCFFLFKTTTIDAPWWTNRNDWSLLLFLLPPMIVYFAAGRGYALATTAFLGALYFLKAYLAEKRTRQWWIFFLLGAFSCLAIVSYLYVFLAMIGYILLRAGDPIFSRKYILCALLLLPLISYVYFVGKTIQLHDIYINGTSNLLVNGMYSTFLTTLSIYENLFAFPALYTKLDLEKISKLLVLTSFIPVVWLLVRKYRARDAELMILLITTLLFLLSHLVVKTKYPSDRSVIFLIYLLYIPIVRYLTQRHSPYLGLHYGIVLLFCLVNFIGFFYILSKPEIYKTLGRLPNKDYTICSDWPNFGDSVTSELKFNGRLHFHYLAQSFEKDSAEVDKNIRSAATDIHNDFLLLQLSTYNRNKAFFGNSYDISPVMTSNYKELYLIRKKD